MRPRAPALIALAGGLAALLWSALVATPHLLGRWSPTDAIEAAFTDLRLLASGPLGPSATVVVIAIDDRTIDGIGGYPVARHRIAAIVDAAADAGARAVAVDILLVDETAPEEDAALAAALARTCAVVAAAARFGDVAGGPVPVASATLWPAPVFADSTAGMVNVVSSATGTPRHVPLAILTDRGLGTHLALRAAAAFAGTAPSLEERRVVVGDNAHALDIGLHLPVRIAGPGGTVPTVSAADLLAGEADAQVAGRLALVGFTAAAVGDTFATPFDPVTPGVEIIATAAAQLLGGDGLVRTAAIRRIDAAASAALATGGVVLVALLPLAIGVGLACGLLTLWLLVAGAAFEAGLWISMALPIAAAGPPLAAAALARHLHERRLANKALRGVTMLERFQSPALARRLAEDPGFLSRPVRRRLAILFVDLAGFTALSESHGPARTFLQGPSTPCVATVRPRRGLASSLNYMGDAPGASSPVFGR